MSKYKEPIKNSINLTSYSDLWVKGFHTNYEGEKNEERVFIKCKQIIVTYKHSRMGICNEIINIDSTYTPKRAMQFITSECTQNVVNISTVLATYKVDVNGDIDYSKEIHKSWKETTFPLFSKKGANLIQIDVNLLALLNVGTMWSFNKKWMSESLGYEGDWKKRESHASLFAPDSFIGTCKKGIIDQEQYLSPFRPLLKQNKLELAA